MHRTVIAFALTTSMLAPFAVAQEPEVVRNPAATSIRIGKEGFVVPAGELTLGELIDKTALYLKRNIFYRPQELAQAGNEPLQFQNEVAVDALGCEELLAQLLALRGFAVVTVDAGKGLYEVVYLGGPRAREVYASATRRAPAEILRRPNLKEVVLTEVQLEHVNANVATNALRPFFAQTGAAPGGSTVTFGTAGSNRTLLVCGFQDQVAQVLRMLQTCDVPTLEPGPEAADRVQRLEQAVKELKAEIQALRQRLDAKGSPAADPDKREGAARGTSGT